jgi:parallel beta-helix repeat protein
MKVLYGIFLVTVTGMSATYSQNSAVAWSSFNNGYATTASATTNAQSTVGELVVGSAQSATTTVETGFLPGTSGPPSVTTTFTVTTESDSVVGSLRWAIQTANATAGLNMIGFDIPGGGVHTITLNSPLPVFTDPVIIDGYTQPGASPNTNPPELGSNAVLRIELRGPGEFSGITGLAVSGGGSRVRGLVMNGFTTAISLENLGANSIDGNFIGTDSVGAIARPNRWGVLVQSPNNTIGGTNATARNVISGNSNSGIFLTGSPATNNHVLGNYLGTSASGNVDITNGCGVWIDAPGNFIGGASENTRNVILGGSNPAVYLPAGNAGGNTIRGNYIGTNAAGTAGLGAAGVHGLTPNNTIANNVISGSRGIFFQEIAAGGNIIESNLLGLTADGLTALENNSGGIRLLRVSRTTIGGTSSEKRNVIAVRNDGINITGGDSNIVQGNYIGTNAAGTIGIVSGGSAGSGVFVASTNNLIGGTVGGEGNVIANNASGITITGGAVGNSIQGNFIGTNAAGLAPIGNITRGISIVTPQGSTLTRDNTIGGEVNGSGNVISGNAGPGIYVVGANANTIRGNVIGLASDGTSPLPNAGDGIQFGSGDSNMIGGLPPTAGNRIAFNGRGFPDSRANGIKMFGGTKNAILGNFIYSNVRLGIDLAGGTEIVGITANDSCDEDSGPNNLQNYPVLTSALPGSGVITIQGTLNSTGSNTTFMLQFFASLTPDTLGYGGAMSLLGNAYVLVDSSCQTAFNVTLPDSEQPAQYVCATATDMTNNTSEFSRSLLVGTTSVRHHDTVLPARFALEQNYPNPFNPTTTITYQLPVDVRVTLRVYDILGREVLTLADGQENAGYHSITLNASGFTSGIYFYRIQAGVFSQTRKLVVLK